MPKTGKSINDQPSTISRFEPLNAKQLQRPSPFRQSWTFGGVGCEPVEETGQGFDPFRPCGVVQPTRLLLKQEIAGAKPARDATLRRVVHGE